MYGIFPLNLFIVTGLLLSVSGQDEPSRDVPPDTMLFTTIRTEPFVVLEESSTGLFRFTGFMVDLWHEMNKLMEQPYDKYIFQPVRDNMYGGIYANGSWSGMIGEVMSGKVDAAMAPLAVTKRRQEVVDLTIPFLHTSIAVLVRKKFNITTIEELLDNKQIKYGTYDESHTLRQMFSKSKEPLLMRMNKYMNKQGPAGVVGTVGEALERVLSEDFAFIGGSDTLEYIAVQNCDLTTFTFREYQNYSIALEKGSRFTEEFNQAIELLTENGKIQSLYNKWWKKNEPCTPGPTPPNDADSKQFNSGNTKALNILLLMAVTSLVFIWVF